MKVETFYERTLFTTALISASDGRTTWRGTGFFVQEKNSGPDPTSGERVEYAYLVSNKHVIEHAKQLQLKMVRASDDLRSPRFGLTTEMLIEDTGDMVTAHPDPEVDVAVAAIGLQLGHWIDSSAPPFFRSIEEREGFIRPKKIAELDAVEEVLFVGYPNGLSDSFNGTPIVRQGITASPIALDYRGEPAFLIDASVYPGSSGSPVFLRSSPFETGRDGNITLGARSVPYFLGVLAAVHTAQLSGVLKPVPVRDRVEINSPMGLGIVYRADAISECLELAMQRARDQGMQSPYSVKRMQ